MSQEPVKEGPFHAEPWGGGGSWAVQPGPIWEEGEFFFFSSPGEKEARRFAKDMNWAYALGQAALKSQREWKPDDVVGTTDNHLVNGYATRPIRFKELSPEVQALLRSSGDRWEKLKAWLENPDQPPNYYTVTDKMAELEDAE